MDAAARIDRSAEAAAALEQILGAAGQVVILHGCQRGGKTELIRGWLLPRLQGRAFYGSCEPALPDTVESEGRGVPLTEALAREGAVIFLDGFDRFLQLPPAARKQSAAGLFAYRLATVVLVVSDECLGELLSLRSLEPDIMDHLVETGDMSLDQGLKQVAVAPEEPRLDYAPELLAAIEADLETFSPGRRVLTPDLVVLIDAHFRHVTEGELGPVGTAHFELIGGLRGILETYLEGQLAEAPAELLAGNEAVLRGVVEEVVACRAGRRDFDAVEPARRVGAPPALAEAAFAWLAGNGLIRETRPGLLELAPVHLEQVVAEALEQKRRDTRDARDIIAGGLLSWKEVHAPLPPESFRAVHELRAKLPATDEEAAFLVQCALRAGDTIPGAAAYWLSRIRTQDAQINAAFAGMFDSAAGVRAGAAALLAGFDTPEVRWQLYRAAVEDPDASVRGASITALCGKDVAEFWTPLSNDARLPASRYRANAVEAIRIFPERRGVELLRSLVSDSATPPEIRAAAIRTLGAMNCAEAAQALVAIGLRDEDEDDRLQAAEALAGSASETVAGAALEALRRDAETPAQGWSGRGFWWWIRRTSAVPLAIGIGVANLVLHGAALVAMGKYRAGFAIFAIEIAVLAASLLGAGPRWLPGILVLTLAAGLWWPMRILLERRATLEVRLGSLRGVLLVVLYVESTFTLFQMFHGLAHYFAGRPRRAALLMGIQLYALGCVGFWYLDQRTYGLTRVGPFYLWTAGALWAASWLWDVIAVGKYYVLAPEKQISRRRRGALYRQLLTNPLAVAEALRLATSADKGVRRWASGVLRRNGDSVPPTFWVEVFKSRGEQTPEFVDRALQQARREETVREVQGLWTGAPPRMRERIFGILARKPNECSLEYLGKLWHDLGFKKQLRYLGAWAEFWLKLVPGMVWVAAALILPMFASLAWHGFEYGRRPSRLALSFVNSPAAQAREPDRVLRFARFVTEAYPEEVDERLVHGLKTISAMEGTSVGELKRRLAAMGLLAELSSLDRPEPLPGVPADAALAEIRSRRNAVAAEARKAFDQRPFSLSWFLLSTNLGEPFDRENRAQVLAMLETVGTPASVETLKHFIVRASQSTAPDRADAGTAAVLRGDLWGLQQEAIRILARIPSEEALTALRELRQSPSAARRGALSETMPALLAQTVRTAYDRGEYPGAIGYGARILPLLQADGDSAVRAQVHSLMAKANWRQALSASAEPGKAATFDSEAVRHIALVRNLRPLDRDEQHVLASCHQRIAERFLPGDPDRALEHVRLALEADPAYVEAYGVRAVALKTKGDADGAFAAAGRALRLNPEYGWAYGMQASIRLDQGRNEEALELAHQGIHKEPDYAWNYALFGESLHRLNRDREAIQRFQALRREYPSNPQPVLAEMYVWHEQLSAHDPSAFVRNYELYRLLKGSQYRDFIARPDDLDAGFIEANFTTGRYREALGLGHEFLHRTSGNRDPRLTVPVLTVMYAAAALSGETKQALEQLDRLRDTVAKLPGDYVGEWSYQGTRNHIRYAAAPEALKIQLDALVGAIAANTTKDMTAVFDANRNALAKRR